MMRTLVMSLVLCVAAPVQADRYLPAIAVAIATTGDPKPAPTPSNVCPNCDGTGRLGDGTIEKVCPTCNGSGKITKRTIFTPPVAPKPAARQLITSPRWLENGHGATVSHLISAHGFSRSQLAGLSQRQLDDLHSDAHNRASRAARTSSSSPCPGGVCPSTRRGIFRRR